MEASLKVKYDPIRSIAFGSIGNTHSPIGGRLTNYIILLEICNTTDSDIFISFSGKIDHIIVPAKIHMVKDYATNKVNGDSWGLAAGDFFQVRYIDTAPKEGKVYISAAYAGE